jgi:hypothetical protein
LIEHAINAAAQDGQDRDGGQGRTARRCSANPAFLIADESSHQLNHCLFPFVWIYPLNRLAASFVALASI